MVETATPARTSRSRPVGTALSARPSRRASPRAPRAPSMAPWAVFSCPALPSVSTTPAPRAAPEETPIRKGSARGLRRAPCMATPARASPPPANRASTVREKRISPTTRSERNHQTKPPAPRGFPQSRPELPVPGRRCSLRGRTCRPEERQSTQHRQSSTDGAQRRKERRTV